MKHREVPSSSVKSQYDRKEPIWFKLVHLDPKIRPFRGLVSYARNAGPTQYAQTPFAHARV